MPASTSRGGFGHKPPWRFYQLPDAPPPPLEPPPPDELLELELLELELDPPPELNPDPPPVLPKMNSAANEAMGNANNQPLRPSSIRKPAAT